MTQRRYWPSCWKLLGSSICSAGQIPERASGKVRPTDTFRRLNPRRSSLPPPGCCYLGPGWRWPPRLPLLPAQRPDCWQRFRQCCHWNSNLKSYYCSNCCCSTSCWNYSANDSIRSRLVAIQRPSVRPGPNPIPNSLQFEKIEKQKNKTLIDWFIIIWDNIVCYRITRGWSQRAQPWKQNGWIILFVRCFFFGKTASIDTLPVRYSFAFTQPHTEKRS